MNASEAKWENFWKQTGIFSFDRIDTLKPIFSIDTPPPYVSGSNLHAGHAMSFTQADIAVRYLRMSGYNIFYPMGFDDNGLPTERFVEKLHKLDHKSISREDFIAICLEETKKQAETYERFFRKLGISVDWSLQYSTIDTRCQKTAQLSFIDLLEKNAVEHKDGPVIWCTYCETALAQSDLEEKEEESTLYTFACKIKGSDATINIATSRPELLPACVALFVNPNDTRYNMLINSSAITPCFEQEVKILSDTRVDPAFGTGAMMVCTWGDAEDIRRWWENDLPTKEIITKDGKIEASIPKIGGMTIKAARKSVISLLEENESLLHSEPIIHVVKCHERCGTIAEFARTSQWYVKVIDNIEAWQKRGDELEWYPMIHKGRYDSWVNGLSWDWCISRQRYYGVPFPVWYCCDCGQIILPDRSLLPVNPSEQDCPCEQCKNCGSSNFRPETDVMDTWMTSSLTPLINSCWADDEKSMMDRIYPITMRVQGFEIIRTWLFYTIVKSHYHTDSLPWKKAMISGWGLDQNGKKISKSSGESADAESLIDKFSADALRFWASESELGKDHRFYETELKAGQRLVTKLINAARFLEMNIGETIVQDPISLNLDDSDIWVLQKLNETIANYHRNFLVFEYSKARKSVDAFFWNVLCDNYLEFIKYRLRSEGPEAEISKQAAVSTFYYCLQAVTKMYAPIIPFATEEVYQQLFAAKEQIKSVHISPLPQICSDFDNLQFATEFELSLKAISLFRKYRSITPCPYKTEIQNATIEISSTPSNIDIEFIKKVMNIRTLVIGMIQEPSLAIEEIRIKI